MNAKALLANIVANPDDDAPRLVYADWLEEHDDIDRATFIRIQIRQAQLSEPLFLIPGSHESIALDQQAKELLRRHGEAWRATLPRPLRGRATVFHRGFIEELDTTVAQILRVSGRVWADHPICRLTPNDATGQLKRVLAIPQLSRIRELKLYFPLAEADLAALSRSARLSSLRELAISGGNATWTAEALARCRSLGGLTRLGLGVSRLDAEGLAALTASANVSSLTDFRLASTRDSATERCRVLARSPRLAALKHLSVDWIGDDGLAALADSTHLTGLRSLHVPFSLLGPAGLRALAATRHLNGLQILELRYNAFGVGGVLELGNGVWHNLAQLGLGFCGLGDEGAVALAECASWPVLLSLTLEGNKITAQGVRALARSPHLRNLEWLSFHNNKISDEGARALCESTTLSNLRTLVLDGCGPFSRPVAAALRRRFGAGVSL